MGGSGVIPQDRKVGIRAQGLDQRSKMEEVMPKMARRRDFWDNPERDEIDSVVEVRRGCKKNFSVLYCIGKKAVTVAAKSGQLTAGEVRKGQFL